MSLRVVSLLLWTLLVAVTATNVLIGPAVGYTETRQKVECFVRSFRRYNTVDDIVLFIQRSQAAEADLIELARYYRVALVVLEADFPWIDLPGLTSNATRNELFRNGPPLPGKYKTFIAAHYFLKAYKYDAVFISDVRDVYFQRNIFEDQIQGVHFFLEQIIIPPALQKEYAWAWGELGKEMSPPHNNTFRTNPWNAEWIRHLYGPSVLSAINDKFISCSGTTIGDHASMLQYTLAMTEEMANLLANPESRSFMSDMWDQAMHNYILYFRRNLFSSSTVHLHDESRLVRTVGMEIGTNVVLLAFTDQPTRLILTAGKEVPAAVHQWDRVEMLTEYAVTHCPSQGKHGSGSWRAEGPQPTAGIAGRDDGRMSVRIDL